MPHYVFCPRQQKKSSALKESEAHWYFYVPKRERERERAKEKGKDKAKDRERERERENKCMGDNISKPPRPECKMLKLYCTIQERAVYVVCS
jgi:hypothetical protein